MSNDFRVLLENTFKFKEGKLYLMLLRDDKLFGVEVVDREKTFGRKYLKTRKEAEAFFDIITDRLNICSKLNEAEDAITKSFKRKSFTETLFLLMVEGKTFAQDECGKIVKKFKLKVKSKYDFLLDKKKKGSITITLFFDGTKQIGKFYGTRFGSDFKFVSAEKTSNKKHLIL